MVRLVSVIFAVFWAVAVAAQPMRVPPVDEAPNDPEFAAFRQAFLDAVIARDIDAILSMTDETVQLSFGLDSGHDTFVQMMTVPEETLAEEYRHEAPALREAYWAALETTLRLGGAFEQGGTEFIAPYLFTLELPGVDDPFAVYWILGESVPLRNRPIRWAAELARLNWDVVTRVEGGEGSGFYAVETSDGMRGFVDADDARALVDYRAIFSKQSGAWKLIFFLAGD